MYQVLARKYRPQTFDDLIGQNALVKTLSNAINANRLGHAFLLTGTRGVGKTTTARIIAKTINCINRSGINPCNNCENCTSINKDNHPDVIEMDAASKTSVEDTRQIIENVGYMPIMGKNKIYIIDEVHMLSKSAFNSLLKTLEEPPENVVFIFATTENHKIPITIISRCIRFDLKNIADNILHNYLVKIAQKENFSYEEASIALLANAATGSARDALSLLDRAANFCIEDNDVINITEHKVRELLGFSDNNNILQIFKFIITNDIINALKIFRNIFNETGNAVQIFNSLAELIHYATILQSDKNYINNNFSQNIHTEIKEITTKLNIAQLTRYWQIILKGLNEINSSHNIAYAAEMLLIRLCYISNLPTPFSLIKDLSDSQISTTNEPVVKSHTSENMKPKTISGDITNFDDVINLCQDKGEILIYYNLVDNVNLVSFKPGEIKLKTNNKAPKDLCNRLSGILYDHTRKTWNILTVNSSANYDETIIQKNKNEVNQLKEEIAGSQEVKTLLDSFPEAQITKIKINN